MKNSIFTQSRLALFSAAILLSLSQCVTPYESARMLPKGGTEIKTSYTHVRVAAEGENEKINDGLGLGLGYGVTDRINLKVRYERLSNEGNVNFVAFGPKIALKPNKIAAMLPIGVYFDEGESTWGVHPSLLFSTSKNNKVEGTVGLRSDIFFEEDSEVLFGINLGLGLSQNLDRWAIRPDFGLTFNPGENGVFLSFGIGAQYNLVPK